ncbi:hypothetical protein F0562_024093 [Nyssa sinensis]|uniref:DUF4283 domain-containing protein n=1 Tax=Nyssa sinensis TaxID=561372 RepID=A0A5J5BP43_9ASTE|nr:hypothetical protein F0562_024093 [Nyssa sinensis]
MLGGLPMESAYRAKVFNMHGAFFLFKLQSKTEALRILQTNLWFEGKPVLLDWWIPTGCCHKAEKMPSETWWVRGALRSQFGWHGVRRWNGGRRILQCLLLRCQVDLQKQGLMINFTGHMQDVRGGKGKEKLPVVPREAPEHVSSSNVSDYMAAQRCYLNSSSDLSGEESRDAHTGRGSAGPSRWIGPAQSSKAGFNTWAEDSKSKGPANHFGPLASMDQGPPPAVLASEAAPPGPCASTESTATQRGYSA